MHDLPKKKVNNHHSIFVLKFITSIIEVEIDILKEIIQNNSEIAAACKKDKNDKLYKWTGTKREIVELIESVLLLGSINNGNVTKSEFFEFIGKILNVNLSNHNKILDDILTRNDDFEIEDKRIKYLPMMCIALSKKLQQLDRKRK